MHIEEVPHPRAGGCYELLGFNVHVSFHSIEAIVIELLHTTMRSFYTSCTRRLKAEGLVSSLQEAETRGCMTATH